jgi:hypothetical protein
MSKEDILQFSWQKGQSGNPNGRPRKFVCVLKEIGYSKQDIEQTIKNMIGMTLSDLQKIVADDDSVIINRTIANALIKSLSKGSLYSIETLISRMYGVPTQTVNQTITEYPIFPGIDLNVDKNDSSAEDI